jgi:hypothetical protein
VKRLLIVPALAVLLSGCGIAAKVNARQDMEASKVAFKACLAQHPQDATPCEGPRHAYEADLAAYRATSAGVRPGPTITVEQPAQPAYIGPPRVSADPMSVIIGPSGQAHPCMAMGSMMTVCN